MEMTSLTSDLWFVIPFDFCNEHSDCTFLLMYRYDCDSLTVHPITLNCTSISVHSWTGTHTLRSLCCYHRCLRYHAALPYSHLILLMLTTLLPWHNAIHTLDSLKPHSTMTKSRFKASYFSNCMGWCFTMMAPTIPMMANHT